MPHIIDTFKDFKLCFEDKLNLSIDEKINLWEERYISKYPELQRKCKEDYESNGYNWWKMAEEMVFNNTKKDFNKMIEAHKNILSIIDVINSKVEKVFSVNLDINIVLYAGLCNSAGWVDSYDGKRAIFYGIDKIAELNWHTMEKLEPLLSHELCHVVHFEIRGEDTLPNSINKNKYNEGIWSLYEEGFAQFHQYKLMDREFDSRGAEWLESCRTNEKQLKELYLNALFDEEKGTRDFYGDWFKVLDISDAGYFLGSELIRILYSKYNIEDIAKLEFSEIENETMNYIRGE